MPVILKNIDQIKTNSNTLIDLENITATGGVNLGIQVSTTTGGDNEYTFQPGTPSISIDTSSLPVGSTLYWDGSEWKASSLIIDEI